MTGTIAAAFLTRLLKNHIDKILFTFGLSLCLFGNKNFTQTGLVFDYFAATVTFALLSLDHPHRANRYVLWPLVSFVVLCALSLALLPWNAIAGFLYPAYLPTLAEILTKARPDSYLYAVSAVLRLVCYASFAWSIATLTRSREAIKALAAGTAAGTVAATIAGILDYSNLISLGFYRRLDPIVNAGHETRLQSLFGHPGWFAEFTTISAPFLLLFFLTARRRTAAAPLFGVLIMIEIALILAESRAGWICYPVTLLFCWIFFYRKPPADSTRPTARVPLRAAVSVPATITASLLVVISFNPTAWRDGGLGARLETRALAIFRVQDRTLPWRDGVLVGIESPVAGTGYENYRWNAQILEPIANAMLHTAVETSTRMNELPTPHNFYISLFAGVGLLGLFTWLALAGAVAYILISLPPPERLYALPFLLTMFAFHVYGVFQSLEYIAVVWLLIFIPIAYGLGVPEPVTARNKRVPRAFCAIALATVPFAAVIDGAHFQSANLSRTHHLSQFLPAGASLGLFHHADLTRELGFFGVEHWSGDAVQWTGQNALLKPGQCGLLVFKAHLSHPDMNRHPVRVDVSVDGRKQRAWLFHAPGDYNLGVQTPSDCATTVIGFHVSRPFVPSETGVNNDDRRLGIALRKATRHTVIGVYPVETLPDARPFQWTDGRATYDLSNFPDTGPLNPVLWASNPDIERHPVTVTIKADAKPVSRVVLSSHDAVTVTLDQALLRSHHYLHIDSDRTWIPNREVHSSDTRVLGAAVSNMPDPLQCHCGAGGAAARTSLTKK